MLKKKILSLVLALSMVSGLGITAAQAETTDSVKEVITDSTSYTNFKHQFNRLHTNTNNLTGYKSDATLARGIGGEDNVCAQFTAEGATITNESRFDTNKVIYDGSTSGQESIGPAMYPEDIMYWSLDVWGNTEIDNIQFKSRGGIQISPVISKSQLKANQWNTLMVIMYPNETNSANMGSVDLFINGEFVSNTDRSTQALAAATGTTMDQLRFTFKFTSEDSVLYVDNAKVGLLTSFTPPLTTDGLKLVDGEITEYVTVTRDASYVPTDYATMTVAELEEATGATVYAADGSEAADSAPVSSDMSLASANTVDGLGTFTASVGISNVAYVLADSSECTSWKNGWNRYVAGASKQTRVTKEAVTTLDGEVCVDYKADSLTEPTRFAVSQCYWVDTATKPGYSMYPGRAEVPMYWSVDVYGNGALTDIKMGFDGNKYINTTGIPASALKENEWNTISAVHYPNPTDDTKLGSADVYLNGELWVAGVDLTSGSASDLKQVILYGTGTSLDSVIYYDNSKCYLMSDVARPFPAGTTVTDNKITGYVAQTVAEFEAATGATVKMADGTDAADDAQIAEGMKVTVTNEVEGIGTLSGTLELGAASVYTLGDWNVTVDGEKVYNNVYTKSGELKATLAVGGSVEFTTILIERAASGAKVKAVAAKQSFTAGGEATVTCDITDGNSYELLVWTSANSMEPLMDKVTVTKAE